MNEPRAVNVADTPDLLRLAQEVARSGMPVMLKIDDEELAVLSPVSTSKQDAGGSVVMDDEEDSLVNIIGIGESKEPTDIATHRREYLAEAYEPTTS